MIINGEDIIESNINEVRFRMQHAEEEASYWVSEIGSYSYFLGKLEEREKVKKIRAEIEDYSDLTDIESYKGKVLDIIDCYLSEIKGETEY